MDREEFRREDFYLVWVETFLCYKCDLYPAKLHCRDENGALYCSYKQILLRKPTREVLDTAPLVALVKALLKECAHNHNCYPATDVVASANSYMAITVCAKEVKEAAAAMGITDY